MTTVTALLLTALAGVTVLTALVWDRSGGEYIEPPHEQAARHWEDLVWSNSRWVNPETPEEGVTRLRPHNQEAS